LPEYTVSTRLSRKGRPSDSVSVASGSRNRSTGNAIIVITSAIITIIAKSVGNSVTPAQAGEAGGLGR